MADGTLICLGSYILKIGTRTVGLSLPAITTNASPSDGIRAMVMAGRERMGGGTVVAPFQTAGMNRSAGVNGSILFRGEAVKHSPSI